MREPLDAVLRNIILAGMLMCLCAIAYQGERDDQLRAMEQYCDLVALHRMDPDVGWPDYNKTFDAQCTQDGKVQPKFYE